MKSNILNKIVLNKKEEVEAQRKIIPQKELCQSDLFSREVYSLKNSIKNTSGLICEYKRKSPSGGVLTKKSIEEVIQNYDEMNVSGISILTDLNYFGGTIQDLEKARKMTKVPLLRKEFIIDEYQLFEAKAHGADAILLIASVLDEYHAKYLTSIAKDIGLEVLMEFHSKAELSKLNEEVDIIGINNRNLDTLKTDIQNSFDLRKYLPYDRTIISESGISSPKEIDDLKEHGYDGFLIGQSILENDSLLKDLNQQKQI